MSSTLVQTVHVPNWSPAGRDAEAWFSPLLRWEGVASFTPKHTHVAGSVLWRRNEVGEVGLAGITSPKE
jgi:hypothetical protein